METQPLANNENNLTLHKSTWEYINYDLADPRTSGWLLMSNPIPLSIILALYLTFVLKLGPEFMRDRKPYSLKRILMVYNLFQVAANIYLFNEAVIMWSNFNWHCQPVDFSNSPDALRIAFDCYLYFLNKISDLSDTIFFILRRKFNQVSFLHVFHHTLMPVVTWIITKYYPGGHTTFVGLLNTFVHILLYGYYYLAAMGPGIQKYLWWKKYITKLQLLQFLLVFIHQMQLLFVDCGFPKWTVLMTAPNAVFFYYLFSEFYKNAYSKQDKKEDKSAKAKNKKEN